METQVSDLPAVLCLTVGGEKRFLPREEAMREFARLHAAGKNPKLGEDTQVGTTHTGAAETVSQVAVARIEATERSLLAAGFSAVKPVRVLGGRVNQTGRDNFQLFRLDHGKAPTAARGLMEFRDQIRAEDRRDLKGPARNLTMLHSGEIRAAGQNLAFSPHAFAGLVARTGIGGAGYLESCPSDLRATNMNYWLPRCDGDVKIRARLADNTAFAVVSPSYANLDGDRVASAILQDRDACAALEDGRIQTVYRPDTGRWEATITWMPDHVVDLAAGDTFKLQAIISGDDTGSGRVRVSMGLWRNLCYNLIILDNETVEIDSAVHRGDASKVLHRVAQAVATARGKLDPILNTWGIVRQTPAQGGEGALEALRDLVRKKALPVGMASKEARKEVLSALERSWAKEPGESQADVVNALTRAAHEESIFAANFDWQRAIESYAGSLVMIPAKKVA